MTFSFLIILFYFFILELSQRDLLEMKKRKKFSFEKFWKTKILQNIKRKSAKPSFWVTQKISMKIWQKPLPPTLRQSVERKFSENFGTFWIYSRLYLSWLDQASLGLIKLQFIIAKFGVVDRNNIIHFRWVHRWIFCQKNPFFPLFFT